MTLTFVEVKVRLEDSVTLNESDRLVHPSKVDVNHADAAGLPDRFDKLRLLVDMLVSAEQPRKLLSNILAAGVPVSPTVLSVLAGIEVSFEQL